jgi:hypothetical protein
MTSKSILIILGLLLAACGDKQAEQPETTAEEQADTTNEQAGHDHTRGPWGGMIVVLGNHEGHIELLPNHEGGAVTIYVYDKDMNEVSLDEPPVLNFVSVDGPVQLEGEGEESEWCFFDDTLKKDFKQLRFRLVMGGKTFTPVWDHVH